MKIDLKQPKYVLPVLALPFLCLFFYVWRSGFSKPRPEARQEAGLNGNVGDVSAEVRKKDLADKLDAYRNTYKEAGGQTAVNIIPKEASSNVTFHDSYNNKERKTLDSIDQAMKLRYNKVPVTVQVRGRDQALANALTGLSRQQRPASVAAPVADKDPMDVFRSQMAYLDSVNKMNDPAYKAEKLKKETLDKQAKAKANEIRFTVSKADAASAYFNTVKPAISDKFIMAAIDENITGYAGSRLRLKLLEDIKAGDISIRKGTTLYAQINGFSEQRVTLVINSILYDGKILPVKLQVYDLDGMSGLYVPSSAFREFTKDLGGNAVQGVTIDGNSGGGQFIMSSVDKIFQSTSSAIADLIRKNKAKLKYNSYIYLIDNDALQNAQKTY